MKILLSLVLLAGLTSCASNWCSSRFVPYSSETDKTALNSEMTSEPVVTAPVVTAPVVTAPVVTAPVVTAPDMTAPMNVNRATMKQIQAKLNSLGMDAGPVDGIYGSQTTSALKKFQASENFDVNGAVNLETLKALNITQ